MAKVSGQIGLLILPDTWVTPRKLYGYMLCFSLVVLYVGVFANDKRTFCISFLSLCET